jgi:hypothetical protein
MKNSIFSLLLLGAFLLAGQSFRPAALDPVDAADSKWKRIGSTKVNFALDRDEIVVKQKTRAFSALKLRVRRSALNLHRITVHYRDGTTQPLDLRHSFAPGSESKEIDLPGSARAIQKVVFWYDTKNVAPRKAVMELWGRLDAPDKATKAKRDGGTEEETKKKMREKEMDPAKTAKQKKEKN